MTRTISTIGLLIAALVVVRSESHGSNDGSDGLAYYGTASASANAFASSSTSVGNFPGFVGDRDRRKGIRSYDESGYAGDKRENGRVQEGRGNNGCPKCKWEDDDYWEKDDEEVEEEIEEGRSDAECYDEDDGRYREHGHDHGHGSSGGTPPGVQKLGTAIPVGQRPMYAGVANAATGAGTLIKAAISPWNEMSPTSSNSPGSGTASIPNQFGASWGKGPETGSGCSGCVQGSSDAAPAKQGPVPFAGNVPKQGSPDYFSNPTSGLQPAAAGRIECSGGIYGNCGENTAGRTEPGSGQYPGSRSAEYNSVGRFIAGGGSGSQDRNPSAFGSLTTLHPATNPSNRGTVPAGGLPPGSPVAGTFSTSAPPSGNLASPNGHGPRESAKRSGYTGAKGNPLEGGRSTPNTSAGESFHGAKEPGPGKGDSKIFYINVSPAPGSPVGVKPRGRGTGSGTATANPSYRPGTKPSYRSGPGSGAGATESPKSSRQPGPPSGNRGWPDSTANDARPSTTGNIGGGCGSGSPDRKACDRNDLPGGVDESSSRPLGEPRATPNDFSQSSRSVFSGDNDRPSSGGGPSTGSGCATSTGCTPVAPSPTSVEKTKNANALPGGEGPYRWNPFLTGKLPSPDAGGPRETTTDRPIGQGNPFLEGPRLPGNVASGAVAGAGARSRAAGASVDKEAIGKGNPFLARAEHSRGDIEIDGSTEATPVGPGAGGNWPIRTASGTPSPGDKAERGAGGGHGPGTSWDAEPAGHASFAAVKNPPATNRGSGSGGGIGFGYDGHGNFAGRLEHGNEDPWSSGSGFSGAFGGSQASSYASSNSRSHHVSAGPNGAIAESLAGSGYRASSGASAYASSSASGWAGTGPISVKG